jgi:hypothetical protein
MVMAKVAFLVMLMENMKLKLEGIDEVGLL